VAMPEGLRHLRYLPIRRPRKPPYVSLPQGGLHCGYLLCCEGFDWRHISGCLKGSRQSADSLPSLGRLLSPW